MNNVWYALWVGCLLLLVWFGFLMGDMEPRNNNKSILKVIGVFLCGCLLIGIYLGGHSVQP